MNNITKELLKPLIDEKSAGGKRVPVAPLIDSAYLSNLHDCEIRDLYDEDFLWPGGEKNAKAQIKGYQTHRYEVILVGSQCKYGRRWLVDESRDNFILKDEYGGISVVPLSGQPYVKKPALACKNYLKKLDIPDFKDGRLDHIDLVKGKIGDGVFVIGGVPEGPFSFAAYLRGPQNFMLDLRKDPDFVKEVLNFTTQASLEMARALTQKEIDAVWVGDGLSSGSLISPNNYRKFSLPYVKKVIEAVHDKDIPVFYHICGRTSKMLDLIEKTGADVFEIDSEQNAGCSITKALRQTDKMIIKGNLEPIKLANWDAGTVYQRSKKLIQEPRPSERFILSTGCFLPQMVSPENVTAMVKAAMEIDRTNYQPDLYMEKAVNNGSFRS